MVKEFSKKTKGEMKILCRVDEEGVKAKKHGVRESKMAKEEETYLMA